MRLIAAVVFCVLTLSSSAGAARVVQQGASPVVFTSARDGDRDVYAVNADGSRLSAVTHNRLYDSGWLAPDGRQLIVEHSKAGGTTVLAVVGPGGRERKLVMGPHVAMDSFSPDSHWIAFNRGNSIWVMQTSGQKRHAVTHDGDYGLLGWSPDSESLLLRGVHHDRSSDLATINRDGSEFRVIAQDVDDAAWGSDGIAVVHGSAPAQALSVVNADGTRPHPLLARGAIRLAGWSPDGTRLAAIDEVDGRDETLFFNAATGRTEIVLVADYIGNAIWAPAGDKLAIEATYSEDTSVFVLKPFPWEQLAVLHPPTGFAVDSLAWSPAGERVAFTSGYRLFVADADGARQRTLANHGDPILVGWASGRI